MTATGPVPVPPELAQLRPAALAYRRAFTALLWRDLHVLSKNWVLFILRTIVQPVMMMFVFTYVFPKIGQGVGGGAGGIGEEQFSGVLVAGVIGLAIIFQGVQAVCLPLVTEFGYSGEIEDRVLAPMPTQLLAIQKIVTGVIQALVAAALVFPIAAVVPATPVDLHIDWLLLVTLAPLSAWVASALGLVFGTKVEGPQVSYLFALVILPLTFLGAIYYPWASLEPIGWLKVGVLANPLVYMTEGFRAAVVQGVPHMGLGWIYLALVGFAMALTWIGVDGFTKRVTT